jgi:hypothetical protein
MPVHAAVIFVPHMFLPEMPLPVFPPFDAGPDPFVQVIHSQFEHENSNADFTGIAQNIAHGPVGGTFEKENNNYEKCTGCKCAVSEGLKNTTQGRIAKVIYI